MQNKICLSIVFILLCLSCNRHKNIIPEDQMMHVMTDMYQLDAVLSQSHLRYNSPHSEVPGYYQSIMNKYGITREAYEKSLLYYAKDDSSMYRLYDGVLANMNKFKGEIDSGKYCSLTHEEGTNVPVCKDSTKVDLNKAKKIFRVPLEGSKNSLLFLLQRQELTGVQKVRLCFSARLYTDDKSINPKCLLIASYPSSSDTLSLALEKNNQWKVYVINYALRTNEKITQMKGNLFECDPQTPYKHAVFWDFHIYKVQ